MSATFFRCSVLFFMIVSISAQNAINDDFIKGAFNINLSPGMAVAVVKEDSVIYAQSFGYADLEKQVPVNTKTMFYIASTTKSFTAFAIALLSAEGRLDMDAALSFYFPGLELEVPLSVETISLRDLITCGHGIAVEGPITFRTAYSGEFTNSLLLGLLAHYNGAEKGRAFEYSNLGYNIASLAMDTVLDLSWKEVLQKEIFNKLDMNNTSAWMSRIDKARLAYPYALATEGFRRLDLLKDDQNMHAAGGHFSSAQDLAQWLIMHINNGNVRGKQLFPAEVLKETHKTQIEQDRTFSGFRRFGWGLGWDLGLYEQDTLIHRFGSFSGYRSHVSFMPQHGIGVVVLVNEGRFGSLLADAVAKDIYDQLLNKNDINSRQEKSKAELQAFLQRGREILQKEKDKIALRSAGPDFPLASCAGTFLNSKYGMMHWFMKDDRLYVQMGLARSFATVYNSQKKQIRVELTGGGEVITFNFNDMTAESLVYKGEIFTRIN